MHLYCTYHRQQQKSIAIQDAHHLLDLEHYRESFGCQQLVHSLRVETALAAANPETAGRPDVSLRLTELDWHTVSILEMLPAGN